MSVKLWPAGVTPRGGGVSSKAGLPTLWGSGEGNELKRLFAA